LKPLVELLKRSEAEAPARDAEEAAILPFKLDPPNPKNLKKLAIIRETQNKIKKNNTQQGSNKTKSTRPRKGI